MKKKLEYYKALAAYIDALYDGACLDVKIYNEEVDICIWFIWHLQYFLLLIMLWFIFN